MSNPIKSYLIWVVPFLFIALLVSFAIYVKSEKQVDKAYELRYQSYRLAEELRDSSDQLTLMARSYADSGDARYKGYYQSILDVRDGKLPRPTSFHNYYSDSLAGGHPQSPDSNTPAVPFLTLIHQLPLPEEELHLLVEAKSKSDALAAVEIKAMGLLEDKAPNAAQMRQQALKILQDDPYIKAKAEIMLLIDNYLKLAYLRTLSQVQLARSYADLIRMLFMLLATVLIGVLFWANRRVNSSHRQAIKANEQYKLANQELVRQMALAESRLQKLTLATQVSGIGIWTWRPAQNKYDWQDNMFDIYGVDIPDRSAGVSAEFWKSLVHFDDLPNLEAMLNTNRGHNPYLRNRFRIVLPDGGIRFIDSASIVAYDAQGSIFKILGINRDISHDIEQQEIINKALEKANAANNAKSAFLANMSHELRTPMTGVLGMLDLLSDTQLSDRQFNWVKTAQESGQVLLEIINDIIDLTHLDSDNFELVPVDFNLVNLVEDTCTALAVPAKAKGLELNCLLPVSPSQWWKKGDRRCIRQVLVNLIGNAIKFTNQGEVFVNVIQTQRANGQSELRFEVHDTGIGISQSALAGLFEHFKQADDAPSRRFGGTGLGLVISKKLVGLMGGVICADSILGKGSYFWFTLPLVASKSGDTVLVSNELAGKQVLIVDSNATHLNILGVYLKNWGMIVTQMDDSDTALKHLQASAVNGCVAYDLILLDGHMPKMAGATLTSCLSQHPALAKIPVILLTPDNCIEPDFNSDAGIVHCLSLPVRQMQLYDALMAALQGREASVHLEEPPATSIQQPTDYQGKKVLVVEDNKINQKVIVALLNKVNIFPDVVENGQLALDTLARSRYDLIFMDCHMSVMDGYTATRELRLLEAKEGLPRQVVIAFTANALNGEFEKCVEAGMDDYVSKPIHIKQLNAILALWLNYSDAASNGNDNPKIADY